MKEVKKEYDAMLNSGDLEILFPDMTGNWEKDKNRFIRNYNKNQEILNKLNENR